MLCCVSFLLLLKGIMAGKSENKRKTDESTISIEIFVNEMHEKFFSHGTISSAAIGDVVATLMALLNC